MDERYWESPQEFNPDRFSSKSMKDCKWKDVFFPFGYGGRSCPGQLVAKIAMKSVLSILLREFKFELVNPNQKLETVYSIVSQPKGGELLVYAKSR